MLLEMPAFNSPSATASGRASALAFAATPAVPPTLESTPLMPSIRESPVPFQQADFPPLSASRQLTASAHLPRSNSPRPQAARPHVPPPSKGQMRAQIKALFRGTNGQMRCR